MRGVGLFFKNERGISLIEVLTTVSITGLLTVLGTSVFGSWVTHSRIITIANEFLTTLNYVRSEAISHNRMVVMCTRDDSSSTSAPVCGTGALWNNGWLVYIENGSFTSGYDSETDQLLRVREPLHDQYGFKNHSDSSIKISFLGTGAAKMSTLGARFDVLPPIGTDLSLAKSVVIDRTGRGRVQDYQ